MANEFKGEITLAYNGKSYTMVFDFNALCDFESETGKNALEELDGIESGHSRITATELRLLMWAGLRQTHEDMTPQLAGKILSANPDAIQRASAAAAPASNGEGNVGNAIVLEVGAPPAFSTSSSAMSSLASTTSMRSGG